jgi:hypothetical protein
MSLLNAPEYDERRAQRRTLLAWTAIVVVIVLLAIGFFARNWTYERLVDRFFTAIEHQDFEGAYALYTADPDWKSHAQKYANYPFGQFTLDWGPSGDWGPIRERHGRDRRGDDQRPARARLHVGGEKGPHADGGAQPPAVAVQQPVREVSRASVAPATRLQSGSGPSAAKPRPPRSGRCARGRSAASARTGRCPARPRRRFRRPGQ